MKCFNFLVKFVLLILITIFVIGTIVFNFKEFGVNKTVGWAWDFSSFIIPLFIIYLSTYLTFYILKVKTNLIFSTISVFSLLACLILNDLLYIILFSISILFFVSNCIYSVYLKFNK